MSPLKLGLIATALATAIIACVSYARADDPWSRSPHYDWYQAAEATPAAQVFFNIVKCCNGAETVQTQFRHKRDTDEWWYLDKSSSTWRKVPEFIIWEGKNPPENKPVLFNWNGNLTCFFAPDTEI